MVSPPAPSIFSGRKGRTFLLDNTRAQIRRISAGAGLGWIGCFRGEIRCRQRAQIAGNNFLTHAGIDPRAFSEGEFFGETRGAKSVQLSSGNCGSGRTARGNLTGAPGRAKKTPLAAKPFRDQTGGGRDVGWGGLPAAAARRAAAATKKTCRGLGGIRGVSRCRGRTRGGRDDAPVRRGGSREAIGAAAADCRCARSGATDVKAGALTGTGKEKGGCVAAAALGIFGFVAL